jgi:hypothetical protein
MTLAVACCEDVDKNEIWDMSEGNPSAYSRTETIQYNYRVSIQINLLLHHIQLSMVQQFWRMCLFQGKMSNKWYGMLMVLMTYPKPASESEHHPKDRPFTIKTLTSDSSSKTASTAF